MYIYIYYIYSIYILYIYTIYIYYIHIYYTYILYIYILLYYRMYHICVSSGKEMKSRMVTLWSMEDFEEARSVARMIICGIQDSFTLRGVGFPAKTYQELADEYLYMYHYMYTYIVCIYIYTYIVYIYIYYIYMYMYIIYIYIYRLSGFDHQTRAHRGLDLYRLTLSHWCRGIPRSIGDGWCHVTSTIVTGGWTNIIYDQHIPTL